MITVGGILLTFIVIVFGCWLILQEYFDRDDDNSQYW